MLSLILDSAIHWIKAGLLLKNLKIVVYSRNPQNYDKSFEELFKCFQEFKCNYDDKELVFVSVFASFILYIWSKLIRAKVPWYEYSKGDIIKVSPSQS